ncbi:MAG: hypothetical protein WED81_02560, partial [Rhodothermales bacterium]
SLEELQEAGIYPAVAEQPDDVDEALRNTERIDQLNKAISEMKREDQLLVFLRFEHGMSANEIAGVMHYDSHKYVYTRLRTVIARLRRQISEA